MAEQIGLIEYWRLDADTLDREIFYGDRRVARSIRMWWRVRNAAMMIRARIRHWIDYRTMNRAAGLYYDRAVAWKGRRVWWSEAYQPDQFNMWADGDWVEVPSRIVQVVARENSLHIETEEGSVLRLVGDPDKPHSLLFIAI